MGKQYRTSRGKMLDIEQLALKNETTVAVGNMNVNARGDELGAGGKVIRTRSEIVSERNKLHTMVPDDVDVPTSVAEEKAKAESKKLLADREEAIQAAREEEERKWAELEEFAASQPKVSTPPKGGLASALAKSQSVEHKPMDPKPEKTKKGVKRL